jgi:N-acyl-D-amino-acid deacylase
LFDLLITNGTVIDGTKSPARRADVAVLGDRIVEIGPLSGAEAGTTIDAKGRIVAPGFIDVHNHSDAWLLKTPHLTAKTTQGFTTEVLMADGISYAPVNAHTAPEWIYYLRALNALTLDEYHGWHSIGEYMWLLEGRNVQNFATHIPYANVRTLACGFGRERPDDYQMNTIKRAIEQGMEEGAVGLSTGLDYIVQFCSDTSEIAEAASAMAAANGLYVTHVRYKKGVLAGVQEAVEIGRRGGVRVHISHLKGTTPEDVDAVLGYLDQCDREGVDLSFDVYPYLPGSTMLSYMLPYEVWQDGPLGVLSKLKEPRIRELLAESLTVTAIEQAHIAWVGSKHNSRHQGKMVMDYIEEMGCSAADALADLLIEERLAVLLVYRYGLADEAIEPFLNHPRFMLGTDGIYHPDGCVHPRMYGSVGRVLGHWAREKKLFSLEDAIWKLAGFPAQRFSLRDRGVLRAGSFADIVVFDANTIIDRATYDDPHQTTVGVEHVIVNGTPILRDGQPLEALATPLPGRYLKAEYR